MNRASAIIGAALLVIGASFRVLHLSWMPGVNGDEGWWGVWALAWLAGQPYEGYTTSGNPIDLLFLIPIAILHGYASPSFLLLRTVAAGVNLLALPVGFLLGRRVFGTTTAWLYTIGIAVLPTAIAHSRIAQDPSQTVFWTSIVIFLSLLGWKEQRHAWRYALCAMAVFPLALWTHPTNIFIGPFLVLPLAAWLQPMLPASRNGRLTLAAATAGFVAVMVLAAWFALTKLSGSNNLLARPWLSIAAARLVNIGDWFELAANGARLFNGVTIYHYFSGARPHTLAFDAAFVVIVAALLSAFALRRAVSRLDYGLLFACAATWLAFYFIAGPQALRPHAERWGLCLIVPSMLVLARGLTLWMESRPDWRAALLGFAAVVAAALLGTFYVNYFHAFATTGGRGHLTYVTAPIEPKRQALEHILARNVDEAPVVIVTHQWWLYWPIRYLASNHAEVTVHMRKPGEPEPDFSAPLSRGRVYAVEFVDTPELAATLESIRARELRATPTTIADASGRGVIEVLEIAPD
jgi:hypothetical protein